MRTVCVSFAMVLLWAIPTQAGIDRWPKVLDMTIGMTLSDARALFAARKTPFREHDDDKPIRKRSVKVRVQYPDGAKADRATLYFLDGRLWQIKLRPGAKLCKELGRRLGKPDGKKEALSGWVNRKRMWGVFCTKGIAHLIDFGALVRAGIDRGKVESDFKRFAAGVTGE